MCSDIARLFCLFLSKSFYAGGRQIREGTQGDGFHLTLRRLPRNTERKENKARIVIVVSVKCRFLVKGKPW